MILATAAALLLLVPAACATVAGSGSGFALGFTANPVTNEIAAASVGRGLDPTDPGLDAIDTAISFGAWYKSNTYDSALNWSDLISIASYEDLNLLQLDAIVGPDFGLSGSRAGWAFTRGVPVASPLELLWGEWHHYFMTWDGDTVTVYMDGVPFGTIVTGSGVSLKAQTNLALILGMRPYGGWGAGTVATSQVDDSFFGALDELSVWSRGLCADEVAQIWNITHDTSNLPDDLVSFLTRANNALARA